ncbi:MAG: response regulator [Gammaproteobacteria bacterium]|nr:response regulator [Gammaproteobacteria bacterium]
MTEPDLTRNKIGADNDSGFGIPKRKYRSLGNKLVLWFLLLALLPITLVAWISYQQASTSLTKAAEEELELSAGLSVRFIENWFDYRFMDLLGQAENQHNTALLMQLSQGLEQSEENSPAYVKSYDWTRRVDGAQDQLIALSRRYDYIHDLLLVDLAGNILYSVARASDLGTNLFIGPYADTRFSQTVRTTLETGQSLFSDLERYAPANNAITGFLTAPLLDEFGERWGVFVIQIRLDRIFNLLRKLDGVESSLNHYLVGADGRLRTRILGEQDEVLERTIATAQFKLWKQEHLGQGRQSDNYKESAFDYIGPDGKRVIGLHHGVEMQGVKWLLISEIDRDEALAAADWLANVTLAMVFFTAVLVVGVAFCLARRITRPIVQLASASMAVAAGETDQWVSVAANDEIGRLAEAFNHMLATRRIHEMALEQSNQQAQKALADLAEQRFALDQHAIVVTTDVRGTITFANDRFMQISGYSCKELLGQNHRLLNSGHHDKEFFRDMYRTIASGKVWHGEICNRAKDGHLYWMSSTITPFKGRDGKPQSYIAIRTDITKRKQAELALKEAKLGAESANRAKSEFLANMSHEIRTPMNGVIGMTNLLLDSRLNQEQQNYTKIINRSAQSLLIIINDILDFSKIEAGRLELELLDFDLNALLEELAGSLVFGARDKGLELIFPANSMPDCWCRGDPGRIRQILTNLVGNAIKFTERGEVVVRYESSAERDGRSLPRFSVTDTGIGLSAEQQRKLFQKFTQADNSTTRKFGGTGLGLSISKKLVELMGGEIGVESELGKGATFWFTLDLAPAQIPPRRLADQHGDGVPPAGSRQPQYQARVLVVEDNATNQAVVRGMLNKFGVHIDMVGNGQEAVHALEQLPYDLVFMDYQMPVMDGYEATRRIRDPQSPVKDRAIAVIAMTANAMQGDRERCIKVGMDDYIAKPVDPDKLRLVLERWLPERCHQSAAQTAGLPVGESSADNAEQVQVSTEPVFDHAALSHRLMEDEALMRVVAEAFVDDMPIQIEQLKTQIAAGDVQQIVAHSHKIKGAAANVGGMALSAIAKTMEQAGKAGELESIQRETPALEQAFVMLQNEINEVLH